MDKYFIPYNIAKELKEIGFNEPCEAYYVDELFVHAGKFNIYKETFKGQYLPTPAPLYDQVIDWFIEKHKIFIDIAIDGDVEGEFCYRIIHTFYPHTNLGGGGGQWDRRVALAKGISRAIDIIKIRNKK